MYYLDTICAGVGREMPPVCVVIVTCWPASYSCRWVSDLISLCVSVRAHSVKWPPVCADMATVDSATLRLSRKVCPATVTHLEPAHSF